ncbi:MAG: GTPase Era [Deltaproteobacteria bacterium]|nr:GTPase Era [Deltaproteobacteria bacterium]
MAWKRVPGAFRAGFVALVGRPNVGKSTILNAVLGQKIAATTHKPQTTRRNLLGVVHVPNAQLMLLDTPGHHRAEGRLNRFMVAETERAVADADVIAWVVEARAEAKLTPGNERVAEIVERAKKPVVVLINKMDRVADKELLLPSMQLLQERFGEHLAAIVPISALKARGLDRAVYEMARALPAGEAVYDEDTMTMTAERDIVAEMIREKIILETKDELPYAVAVTIDAFEDGRPDLVRIEARIHVERESQKGIVIGKGGERLKTIGMRARKDVEYFLGSQVYLGLEVGVSADWSEDARLLKHLGYVNTPPVRETSESES